MRGLCFAVALSATSVWAQWPVSLDETQIRATLKDNATIIAIPLTNTDLQTFEADLSLQWLSPGEVVQHAYRRKITIASGRTTAEVPLPLHDASLWTRLRYTVSPAISHLRAFAPLSGVVALPQLASHVFEVKVSHVGLSRPGQPLVVHAEAMHPVTHRPVAGVDWSATLTLDNQKLVTRSRRAWNDRFIDFTFDWPAGSEPGDAIVTVKAVRGDFGQEVSLTIPWEARPTARIQTDKPIYQPGQLLHLRAIVLTAAGRAMTSEKVTLHVDDDSGERVHTAELTTSPYGVVTDDWALPSTADLGTYRITLNQDEELAAHAVRVSRYELPSFRVTVQPDRTAYLPQQPIRVRVEGAYLFGKPVPRGKVKITRDGEETPIVEGVAGDDGVFTAGLSLAGEFPKAERFNDLHFAASYQDPASGRTEQRRFDVRLSREPIHVYFSQVAGGLAYVTTSYADGRPTPASVQIGAGGETVRLRTNRYGVGRTEWNQPSAHLEAIDAAGLSGHWQGNDLPGARPAKLRFLPTRTVHRTGEAVRLRLATPAKAGPDQFVMIHAIAGGRRVASQVVHLENQQGEVTFPYQPEFRRTVVFVAAGIVKTVTFPDGSDLALELTTNRAIYRPGEKASLKARVSTRAGQPVEAALGLAIVDSAVLERARTDTDFGGRPWFACAFCGDANEAEIGGVRLNDLYALKPGTPITSELDLVAEALLAHATANLMSETGDTLAQAPDFSVLRKEMEQLRAQLDRRYNDTLDLPQTSSELQQL